MQLLKNYIFVGCLLLSQTAFALNTDITTDSILRLGLPVVYVTTVNGEEPACDYAFAPEGAFGITTINNTKVAGRCMLLQHGDTLFDSGDYEKDKSGMTIKIHGNTSAYYSDKKSFRVKLEKKNDLMARGDSCYYDKNWVLLRTGDCLYTLLGNEVSRLVGMPWTPDMMFVNLIVNNDYRGIYMLTEKVKRNADCRLNVDKHTGFIIERDAYWWSEEVYLKTDFYQKEYTFKYPDDKDVTEAQTDSIRDYLNRFEESIDNGTYTDYIDLHTWTSWIIGHDILGTYDTGGSNMYLSKYDNSTESLLQMATMWDFDSILKTPDDWSRYHYDDFFYYHRLFNNENPTFKNAFIERFHELLPTIFNDLKAYLDTFEQSSTAKALTASYPYEYARWKYDDGTLDDKLHELRQWLDQRELWLNSAINNMISTVDNASRQSSAAIHTPTSLSGRPVRSRGYKGIIVFKGKKIVK